MADRRKRPLLSEVLPALAEEVTRSLRDEERPDLASQVPELRVKSRCGCGDDFCATIYTGPGRPAYSVPLESANGDIVVDVDEHEQIIGIEVLFRDEYKALLDAVLPPGGGRRRGRA